MCLHRVAGAIRDAARSTGASFEYLLTAARIESNLNPAAQATTSSATGLYQFIDQTWLATLKSAGPAHGYGQYADAITQGPDGRYEVADPNMRAAIMRLRNDPAVSATMAGAFTQTNAAQLAGALGRQPSEGELYIAHFLGSEGAAKLIGAMKSQPDANAAQLFPQAAAANPGIFVNKSGQPRSVSEVYTTLTGRFEVARATAFGPALRGAQAAMPDPAGVTQAYAAGQYPAARHTSAGSGGAAGHAAAFPEHVQRSRQPRGDAGRHQFVDAGRGRYAGRQQPAAAAQFVHRPARCGGQAVRRKNLKRGRQITAWLIAP